MKAKETVTWKYTLGSTPSQYNYETVSYVLIYGAANEVYNPATFASVLGPFPWQVWILVLAGSSIAVVHAARQSK